MYFCKNFIMDFVLLAFVILFFLKGFCKGLANIIFSLLSTVFIFSISIKFCQQLGQILQNANLFDFEGVVSKVLNSISTQTFSSVDEVSGALNSNVILSVFLKKLLSNITFDGEMTLAQIFAPTLNALIFKILAFVLIYFVSVVIFKFFGVILSKMLKKLKLGVSNMFWGGAVGLLKGVIVFSIVYAVVLNIGNILLNENIIAFCNQGVISKFLYNNFTEKIISLFY